MALMRRRNCIVNVADKDAENYYNRGYDYIDEKGNVLKEAVPNDTISLTSAYHKHTAEIAKLKEENEKLLAEIAKLKEDKTTTRKTAKQ